MKKANTPQKAKKTNFFLVLFIAYALILSGCYSSKAYVRFRTDEHKVESGGEVAFSWKIKSVKQKDITHVEIPGISDSLPMKGSLKAIVDSSYRYVLKVHKKDNSTLRRYHKVKAYKPEIEYFTAHISKQTKTVQLAWKAKNAKTIEIQGISDTLKAEGTLMLPLNKPTVFELIAHGDYNLDKASCGVDFANSRIFICGEKNIDDLLAKQKIKVELFDLDNENFPKEIKVKALVVDSTGHFIRNLAPPFAPKDNANKYFKAIIEQYGDDRRKANFRVKEVHENAKPYDIVLTLDYSGSMAGSIGILEESVRQFIAKKHPNDRLSIVKFDGKIKRECELMSDTSAIFSKEFFNGLDEFGGSTALYAACDISMDELISSKRKKIIVLFTDGHENASLPYFLKRNTNITQIAKKMRRFNTHMYIISYGNGVNKDLLNGLASITNGKHYNINYAWQIDKVLKEIQHIIRNHYEISYRPYFKEISRTIELAYDNHNNETNVVKKDFVIKKDIDLSVHECDKKSYWYDTTFAKNNKTPIAPPQIAINFDYDRYMLKAEYEKNLNKYITYLKINNDAYVKLIGHTDMTGYEQYNRVLSQQRAESVKNYLVNKGIKSNRIFAEGQGAENPIWNPEDAYFKAYENRRVEIVIYK